MGPRRAGDPPQYSSTPPRPPDPGNLRMKLQVELEETAAGFRELHKSMASMATEQAIFQSEILNELRQFRLERTAQLRPPPPPPQYPPTSLPPFPASNPTPLAQFTASPLPLLDGAPPPIRPPKIHSSRLQIHTPPLAQPTTKPPPLLDGAVSAQPNSSPASFCSVSGISKSVSTQFNFLNVDCSGVGSVFGAELNVIDEKFENGEGGSSKKRAEVNIGDGREFNELESVGAKQDDSGLSLCGENRECNVDESGKGILENEIEYDQNHSNPNLNIGFTNTNTFNQLQSGNTSGLSGLAGITGQSNFGQSSVAQGVATVPQPIPAISPIGTLTALPQMSIAHVGTTPSIQCGISSIPVIPDIGLNSAKSQLSAMEMAAYMVKNESFGSKIGRNGKPALLGSLSQLPSAIESVSSLLSPPIQSFPRSTQFMSPTRGLILEKGDADKNRTGELTELDNRLNLVGNYFQYVLSQSCLDGKKISTCVVNVFNDLCIGLKHYIEGSKKTSYYVLQLCFSVFDKKVRDKGGGHTLLTDEFSIPNKGGNSSNSLKFTFSLIISLIEILSCGSAEKNTRLFTKISVNSGCVDLHHDQGLISSGITFNSFLVHRNGECIVIRCSNLLQRMSKLQLHVEVVHGGISRMIHTSLSFKAAVDLSMCAIIEFSIVATLNVWLNGTKELHVNFLEDRMKLNEECLGYVLSTMYTPYTMQKLGFKFNYQNLYQLLFSLSKLEGDLSFQLAANISPTMDITPDDLLILEAELVKGDHQLQLFLPYDTLFVVGEALTNSELLQRKYQFDPVDVMAVVASAIIQLQLNEATESYKRMDKLLRAFGICISFNHLANHPCSSGPQVLNEQFVDIVFFVNFYDGIGDLWLPAHDERSICQGTKRISRRSLTLLTLHHCNNKMAQQFSYLQIILKKVILAELQHVKKAFDEKGVAEIAKEVVMDMTNARLYATTYTEVFTEIYRTLQLSEYEIRNSDELFNGGLAKLFPQIKSASTPLRYGCPSAISIVITLHSVALVKCFTALGVMETTENTHTNEFAEKAKRKLLYIIFGFDEEKLQKLAPKYFGPYQVIKKNWESCLQVTVASYCKDPSSFSCFKVEEGWFNSDYLPGFATNV